MLRLVARSCRCAAAASAPAGCRRRPAGSTAHLGLLVLQQPQQILLLLIVLGPSIREDIDEGAGVREFHGQPDGSHAHLRAIPSALRHTGRDVARAPSQPVLSPSPVGSQQDPTRCRLVGRNRTSLLESQTKRSPSGVTVPQGHAGSQGPIPVSPLTMIKPPIWGSRLRSPWLPTNTLSGHIHAHPSPSPPTWQENRPPQASAGAQRGPAPASTGLCTPKSRSHSFTPPTKTQLHLKGNITGI